jgi:hypothetical protein
MADRVEINARLAECSHNKVVITWADIERIIRNVHDEDIVTFGEELRLTDDYIPELSEIVLRKFENPNEIRRLVENFLFEGAIILDVKDIHMELGIYDRRDWLEEMDKYCPECGEIYLNEDPNTETAQYCSKCGTKLEINNGL